MALALGSERGHNRTICHSTRHGKPATRNPSCRPRPPTRSSTYSPPAVGKLTIQQTNLVSSISMAGVAKGAVTSGSACRHSGFIRTDLIPQPTYFSRRQGGPVASARPTEAPAGWREVIPRTRRRLRGSQPGPSAVPARAGSGAGSRSDPQAARLAAQAARQHSHPAPACAASGRCPAWVRA